MIETKIWKSTWMDLIEQFVNIDWGMKFWADRRPQVCCNRCVDPDGKFFTRCHNFFCDNYSWDFDPRCAARDRKPNFSLGAILIIVLTSDLEDRKKWKRKKDNWGKEMLNGIMIVVREELVSSPRSKRIVFVRGIFTFSIIWLLIEGDFNYHLEFVMTAALGKPVVPLV